MEFAHFDDFLFLLDGEDVGDEAAVEQRVDVLQKGVVLQLRIQNEEDDVTALSPGGAQDSFDVLAPFVQSCRINISVVELN